MCQQYFQWPCTWDKLYSSITDSMQSARKRKTRYPESHWLYYPLPCPDIPWPTVHIDFITDFLEDEGCSTVMILVDRFSNMCSFILLSSTKATSVATTSLFNEVVAHHGLPRQIVSDHNPQLTSEFWHCLMSTLKTNLQFSTVFHPQNGWYS